MEDEGFLSGGGQKHEGVSRYKKVLVFVGSSAVIVAIVLIISLVLLKQAGNEIDHDAGLLPFTLDSVFNSSLSPRSFSLQWGGNGQYFIYQNSSVSRDWLKFDLTTKEQSIYVNATQLAQVIPSYGGYFVSADGTLILFSVSVTAVWRHSYVAIYLIYNVAGGTVQSLVDGDPYLQNVVWSPTGDKVAYVLNNDIYIRDIIGQTSVRVTNDGNATGGILNGIQSWVYEEEVFSDFSAIWWSQDGSYIAYLRFNESNVNIFEYTIYSSNAYPTQIPLRYPKAGYPNPEVELFIYDLTGQTSVSVSQYGAGNTFEYIASVQWNNQNQLWIQQLYRSQNYSVAGFVSKQGTTWTYAPAFTQISNAWIDISSLTFCQYDATNAILLRMPLNDHYHIASFTSTPEGNWAQNFLTSGDFDVVSISGCTPDGQVYYLSTEPGVTGATFQHIYYTALQTPSPSTRVSQTDGFYSTNFSPLGDYYVMRYLGPNVPQHYLVATAGGFNLTVESNERYSQIITGYVLPEKTFTTVIGADGQELNAYFKKPKHIGSGFPLIIDVYAGPGTQDVRQIHDVAGLDAWLCAQGFVVAAIDGRGTGGRGLSFMQATYRQLGLVESADQRAGAHSLAEQIGADSSRVGIWGWSFGGFMSALGISNASPVGGFTYKAAVSVAPVTDWTLYDTIYTERFMSTPQDNPEGYNATSVIQRAAHIPGHTLLLMHGLADDNVHFQNTAEFVMNLIQSNVQFDTMFYPNDNHAINGGNSRRYLYEKMIDFLKTHL